MDKDHLNMSVPQFQINSDLHQNMYVIVIEFRLHNWPSTIPKLTILDKNTNMVILNSFAVRFLWNNDHRQYKFVP